MDVMPTAGVSWAPHPEELQSDGYCRDDCLFNLAWNQLDSCRRLDTPRGVS
jgi:hypothetical protein